MTTGPARPSREELVARAARPAADALRLHALCRGKMQTLPKCPVRGFEDFAVWYTPGVAAASRAIAADAEAAWVHTNRGNTTAIVTDGSRVLGLGDIGPTAALPVCSTRDASSARTSDGCGSRWSAWAPRTFPGLFRGALDVRARTITDGMAGAVAREIARFAEARGIGEDDILPRMDEWDVHVRVAVAAAMAAQAEGVARLARPAVEVESEARARMQAARDATTVLMRAGLIPDAERTSE